MKYLILIMVGLASWFIGWIMGYKKGYDINKIYRNMYLKDNYFSNTRTGALENDRVNEKQNDRR
jgi:hypothetical protein|tara:strand:+ start:874 stop:1065 length:192 start_codon:yes stop_codon:yes gene_type:complete